MQCRCCMCGVSVKYATDLIVIGKADRYADAEARRPACSMELFRLRVIVGEMSGRTEVPCGLFCCALVRSMAFLFYDPKHIRGE